MSHQYKQDSHYTQVHVATVIKVGHTSVIVSHHNGNTWEDAGRQSSLIMLSL